MILYRLEYNVEYEGTFFEGAFSTRKKAERYMNELLEKKAQSSRKYGMKEKDIEEYIQRDKESYSIDKIKVDDPNWYEEDK